MAAPDLLSCTSEAEHVAEFASSDTYLSFCQPPASCKLSCRQSASFSQLTKLQLHTPHGLEVWMCISYVWAQNWDEVCEMNVSDR